MAIIYGIRTCGNVRKAIKFFTDNNLEFIFHDIRNSALDADKIEYFTTKVDINILLNNKGTKYRDLKLKDLNLNDYQKLKWLQKENMLLKRPIIEYKDNVICAYNEDIYKKEFL
jgi:arsenate reductase (glutaredoxin)